MLPSSMMRDRLNALSLDPSAIICRKHDVHVAWVTCKTSAPVRAIERPGNPSSIKCRNRDQRPRTCLLTCRHVVTIVGLKLSFRDGHHPRLHVCARLCPATYDYRVRLRGWII